MAKPSLRWPLAGLSLAALALSLVLSAPWRPGRGSAWLALAVPADAFEASGLSIPDTMLGIDALRVQLSDFSRVRAVPLSEALARAGGEDPRRTPLLDELAARFSVIGPEGRAWRVVYAERPSAPETGRFVAAVKAAGLDFAEASRGGSSWLAALPLAALAAWAVFRRRKTELPSALAFALAAMPLAASLSLAGSLAGIAVILAGFLTAYPFAGLTRPRKSLYGLPAAALAAAALAVSPSLAPRLLSSASILGLAASIPREALRKRFGLHAPPRFVAIAGYTLRKEAKLVAAFAAGAAIASALSAALTGSMAGGGALRHEGAYKVDFDDKGSVKDAQAAVEAHAAFQQAITYGRLGEASWGSTGFTPAYRYHESGGRLVVGEADRSKPKGNDPNAWTAEDGRLIARILEGPVPLRVVENAR